MFRNEDSGIDIIRSNRIVNNGIDRKINRLIISFPNRILTIWDKIPIKTPTRSDMNNVAPIFSSQRFIGFSVLDNSPVNKSLVVRAIKVPLTFPRSVNSAGIIIIK